MIMEFETFKTLINLLEKADEVEDKLYNYVHIDTIWDSHNKAITLLLEQVFPQSIVDYVIFPYVYEHDKTPVKIDNKEYRIDTIEELYKVVKLLSK